MLIMYMRYGKFVKTATKKCSELWYTKGFGRTKNLFYSVKKPPYKSLFFFILTCSILYQFTKVEFDSVLSVKY
jgi:hypothetical protein